MLEVLKLQFMRIGRRLLWPRPALYAPIGILRNRGNVFSQGHELYISGFPRSGNTFAVTAFELANPGTRVRSHKHIPSFVIQSVRYHTPGMVLVRNPIDAAISWAICRKSTLLETLAYYTDYHRALLPYREELFFVAFEEVISDFGRVMISFNARWRTNYTPFQHVPENIARCIASIESEYLDGGTVNEARVPRPSSYRKPLKEAMLRRLNRSPRWQQELYRANEMYQILAPRKFSPSLAHKTTTTQSIRLRPAT